jgi:Na+/melibiose symporter-like transporter
MTATDVIPAAPTNEPRPRVPLFSLSSREPLRTDPHVLAAFLADRRLMVRNVVLISLATVGWKVTVEVITPLMGIQLLDLGVGENVQGTITSANFWALSFLVMFFGWLSDHTVSRLGRRKPYLFIAAPVIVAAVATFPFLAVPRYVPLLLMIQGLYLLFLDLKDSTFKLVTIDCVPGRVLARAVAIVVIVQGLASFGANRYARALFAWDGRAPYLAAAGVMTITTIAAALIREPPIYHPPAEPFRPWSTFRVVAAYDRRTFVLMAGIALLYAFPVTCTQWLWFWSKQTLGFSRGDILTAVSWSALANVVLSYPLGWVVDRFGGMRVVVLFVSLCAATFAGMFFVHSRAGLTLLVAAQTVSLPVYWSADILVYKSCPRADVGAFTSTNSCLRNAFLGCLSFTTGWVIYLNGHNYRLGFALALALTVAGGLLCWAYQRLCRTPIRQ